MSQFRNNNNNNQKNETLEILLATYNGVKFLPALLDSILVQDDTNFILRVRDDGSTDGTGALLLKYAKKFDHRLVIEEDNTPSGSSKGNFARLMLASDADYVLWADQDDIWSPNHVSEVRRLLVSGEAIHGSNTPIYTFTDAIPIDVNLNLIADSFFSFKKIDPKIVYRLSQCLVCPPMLGCASGINRALLRLASPVPIGDVTGHDWWSLLLAVAVGKALFSKEKTVLYRIHRDNVSSPRRTSVKSYWKASNKRERVRRGMRLRFQQARAVQARLEFAQDQTAYEILETFVRIEEMNPVHRRWALLRGGFHYPDIERTAAMLALC